MHRYDAKHQKIVFQHCAKYRGITAIYRYDIQQYNITGMTDYRIGPHWTTSDRSESYLALKIFYDSIVIR